ncbi:hypothetical protein B0H16DRAFT_1461277 [Mycena metata]|uniref:Uncharacterized protein n=1 Tax=Mycena metata TaxID=1033252 RepID=A0AAD7N6S1_9AGAR|nr:hypothetical protein B0H16DRAFT_1461277 [Mycena metata]
MAPNKTTELFRGNGTAEKAHTWLRSLEQTGRWDAEEKEKLYRLEKGLHPGSQAEEWLEALDVREKANWKALMAAFEKKWAKPKASRRGQDFVIQELLANKLDHGDLGKDVKDEDGTSVLSHVAWAETVRNLLGELPGGNAAMMLKSAVRKTLPVEFRTLVEDQNSTTWEKYLKAVEDVQLDRISDTVEVREIHARTSNSPIPRTPSDVFAAQLLQSLGLSDLARKVGSPLRAPPTPYTNPRGIYIPRRPDSRSRRYQLPHPIPSANRSRPVNLSGDPARDVNVLRRIAESPHTYAADPAGIQRYTSDFAAWMSQNGNIQSPDYVSFPFTPGTTNPGSRECFRCGKLTVPPHFGTRVCLAQNGTKVHARETNL